MPFSITVSTSDFGSEGIGSIPVKATTFNHYIMNAKVSIYEAKGDYTEPKKDEQVKVTWVNISIYIDDLIVKQGIGRNRLHPDDEDSPEIGYNIAKSRALIKACERTLKALDEQEKYCVNRLQQIAISRNKVNKLLKARTNRLKEYNLKH